jgi:rRNA maturation protein Nop10
MKYYWISYTATSIQKINLKPIKEDSDYTKTLDNCPVCGEAVYEVGPDRFFNYMKFGLKPRICGNVTLFRGEPIRESECNYIIETL